MTHPMTPVPLPIARVTRETHDTVTLGFARGLPFRPGQFNMLYLFGVGEVAISVSGDPARADELVHTVRAVGSVTTPLCALQPGRVVGVRGPYGSAWPVDDARGRDVVILAGGLGLAPLRPVVIHVLHHRADSPDGNADRQRGCKCDLRCSHVEH